MSTRDDWLAWRRQGLGASDAAAVSGFSKWGSPWSVWVEKTGLVTPEDGDDEMAEFGRRFEAIAAPWFHERTGLYVVGEQTWCSKPDEPWARATPDGFVAESPDAAIDEVLGTYETKAPVDWSMWEHGLDAATIGDGSKAPVDYQVQALWQQYVTSTERTWFGVLHGRRFRIYELAQDGPDLAYVVDACKRFWFEHVLPGNPPPVDGHDATTATLKRLYPHHDEGTTIDVGRLRDDLDIRAESKRLIALHEAEIARIDNEVRAALEDCEEGTVDGERVVTYKAQTARRVDTTRLRAELPEIADEYSNVTESRVLRYRKAN